MTTDISAVPTRLSEQELAEHLSDILDRVANGERIFIERDGKDIVVLEPALSTRPIKTWGEFVHWLAHESTFDQEFAETVRELRKSQPLARWAEWPE